MPAPRRSHGIPPHRALGRVWLRRPLALLTSAAMVLALAVIGAFAGSVANADPASVPVSGLQLTSPTHTPLVVGDTVTLTGNWGPIDYPQASDSFTLTLPSVFATAFTDGQSFPLGSSSTYGTCVISGGATAVTCTLNGDHSGETGVAGSFGLELKARATTSDSSVSFQANGDAVSVSLPGGGITDGSSLQKGFTKTGALQGNKYSIKWTVTIGGDEIAGMPSVAINDDLTGGTGTVHTLCTSPAPGVVAQGRDTTAPSLVFDATTTPTKPTFTLTAPADGFDSNTKYVLTYYTCTTGDVIDAKGDTYVNAATYTDGSGASHGTGSVTVSQDWELTTPTKSGSFLKGADRYKKIQWTIDIPGSQIKGQTKVDLEDTLGLNQELCAPGVSPYGLNVAVSEWYGPNSRTTITNDANVAYASSSSTAFTITLNNSGTLYEFKDSPYVYRVTYTTCVTTGGLPDFGAAFTNSVKVNSVTVDGTATMDTWAPGKTGTIKSSATTVGGQEYPANTTIGWDLTIPGEKIETVSPSLTLTDTPSATQAVCAPDELAGTSSDGLKSRLGLSVKAVDQVTGGGMTDVDLLSNTVVSLSGSVIQYVITPPSGFSREYQYKVSYALCTASGGLDAPGTVYSNAISGVGTGVSGSKSLDGSAWGTGSGVTPVSSGSFALTKDVAGDGADLVNGATYTVRVKEIPPSGSTMNAQEYDVTLKGGDTTSGLHALGAGWTIELTEPTATLPGTGAVWGEPVFTGGVGVTVTDGGKTATVTPAPGGANIAVTLTNTLRRTYAVGDYTWIDSNENGIQDSGEEALDGVGVELFDSAGNPAKDVYGVTVPSTTTDSNGWYMFDNLPAGTYRVKFALTPTQAATYQFTRKDAGADDTLDSDANAAGLTDSFTLDASNTSLVSGATYNGNAGYLIPAGTTVKASEGIDPTWDAGVHVKHPSAGGGGDVPPPDTPSTPATPTSPTTTSTSPTTGTPTTTPARPTVPTVVPSSATSPATPPPAPNVPTTTVTVSPNQCVDMTEHGFEPGEPVRIIVTGSDGQYEIAGVAGDNGDVTYCLDASKPDTLTIQVLGEHRSVVRQVVIQPAGGALPNTGVAVLKYVTIALLLLGAGVALVIGGRRRRGGGHHLAG